VSGYGVTDWHSIPGYEILTVLYTNISVLSDVTSRRLAEKYGRYEERSASIFRADDNTICVYGIGKFLPDIWRHVPEYGIANGEFVFYTVTTLYQWPTFFSLKPVKTARS
jgi:hypothetical protein